MRIYVESYGCTANRCDGAKIERLLESRGHSVVDERGDSDAVLYNTCTVVQSTEDRLLHRIEKEEREVLVSGCMVGAQEELVRERRPDATLIESTGREELLGEKKLSIPTEPEGVVGNIQVAEGCLGECTYCITKLARGDVTSLPPRGVREQAEHLLERGARELRITSQDNGAYGADIDREVVDAVEAVLELERDFRLRVGMMNPFTADRFVDRFDELFSDPRVYSYLHLPLQSSSDRLLRKMGREHTADDFLQVVEEYRDAAPDGTLFTDVIAGFPGETEEEHRRTVELLEELEPEGFNITRFSPRPGTEAAEMEDRVPHEVKKERSKELHELRHRLGEEVYSRRAGETVEAMVVEEGKEGSVVARDYAYTPIAVQEELPLGKMVEVELQEAESTYLMGERTREVETTAG